MRAGFSDRTINCLQWFIMYFCRFIAVFWRLYIQHIQINMVVFCTLTILSKFTEKKDSVCSNLFERLLWHPWVSGRITDTLIA